MRAWNTETCQIEFDVTGLTEHPLSISRWSLADFPSKNITKCMTSYEVVAQLMGTQWYWSPIIHPMDKAAAFMQLLPFNSLWTFRQCILTSPASTCVSCQNWPQKMLMSNNCSRDLCSCFSLDNHPRVCKTTDRDKTDKHTSWSFVPHQKHTWSYYPNCPNLNSNRKSFENDKSLGVCM